MIQNSDNKLPRALFVGHRRTFINPSHENSLSVFGSVFNMDFFGPGFVSRKQLVKGLLPFIKAQGPYQLIITDPYVVHWRGNFSSEYSSWKPGGMEYCHFDIRDPATHPRLYAEGLESLEISSALLAIQYDSYNVPEAAIEDMKNFPGFIIGIESNSVPAVVECPRAAEESFGENKTDLFREFAAYRKSDWIPWSHVLGEDEIMTDLQKRRPIDIASPGVKYKSRRIANDSIRAANLQPVIEPRGARALSKAWDLGIRLPSLIKQKQRVHEAMLRRSKCAYVDGSFVRAFVRKYFEVGAAGAAMVGSLPPNAEAMGFLDQVNFVHCAPENAGHEIVKLLADRNRLAGLSKHGNQLSTQFTVTAFASRVRNIQEKIIDQTYRGASWKNGQWELR